MIRSDKADTIAGFEGKATPLVVAVAQTPPNVGYNRWKDLYGSGVVLHY